MCYTSAITLFIRSDSLSCYEFFPCLTFQGKVWVAYADLELRHGLFPRVEAIFARCLRNSTSIDLWAFYITYIRRMNKTEGVDPEKAKQARNTIIKSYDFCLGHVGQDRSAGQLWNDYIIFLRSSEVSEGPFGLVLFRSKAYQPSTCRAREFGKPNKTWTACEKRINALSPFL